VSQKNLISGSNSQIRKYYTKWHALIRELYLKTVEGGAKLKAFLIQQKILNLDGTLGIRE
jgi:hypothetical protein